MKATLEKLEANKVRVNIELGADDVEKALQRAYRKVVRQVRIPGFRKGKAPRPILERYVGKGPLYEEAIEDLVPDAYADAVDELQLEPIAQPEFDIVKFEEGEGFQFHADVQVKPEVNPGNYLEVRQEYTEPEVTDEAVDEELERIRRARSQLVALEGENVKLEEGQFAVIDFEGFVDGEPIPNGSATEYVLEIGSGSLIEGFEEQLVGMAPEEEREITVTFPEDYNADELAGKEAQFKVKLHEIKQRELPELDEELFKELGNYESVDDLKAHLREDLEASEKRDAERNYRNAVIAAVVDGAEVEVPDVLTERRIDSLIQEFRDQLRRQNFTLEQYLEQTGQPEADLRTEFHDRAERDIRTDLVLEAIAKKDDIHAEEEDLEAEIQAMASLYNQPADAFRTFMLSGESGEQLRYNVRLQKTIGYLEALAQGADPEEAREQATRNYRERLERTAAARVEAPAEGPVENMESTELEAVEPIEVEAREVGLVAETVKENDGTEVSEEEKSGEEQNR